MGTEYTPDPMRAIGVPLKWTQKGDIWEANTTRSLSAGGYPGRAVFDATTAPAPSTKGLPAATGVMTPGTVARVRTLIGGNPGRRRTVDTGIDLADESTYQWQRSTDALWRKWEGFTRWLDHEIVADAPAPAVGEVYRPSILVLDDGTILVAVHKRAASGGIATIRLYTWDPSAGTWSNQDIHTEPDGGLTATEQLSPVMVRYQDDSIVLFHYTHDEPRGTWNIGAYVSWDDGVTWTQRSATLAGQDQDITVYEPQKLTACELPGQTLVVASVRIASGTTGDWRNRIFQYAGANQGDTLTLMEGPSVAYQTLDSGAAEATLVSWNGQATLYYLGNDTPGGTSAVLYARTIGSAFDLLEDATQIAPAANTAGTATVAGGSPYAWDLQTGELAAMVDHEGTHYAVYNFYTGQEQQISASVGPPTDAANTYNLPGSNPSHATSTPGSFVGATDYYPVRMAVAPHRGAMVHAHLWETPTSNRDDALSVAWLGGYDDAPAPVGRGTISAAAGAPEPAQFSDSHRLGWLIGGTPTEDPGQVGWTVGGIGTGSYASGQWNTATTVGQTLSYLLNPTASVDYGIMGLWEVRNITSEGLVLPFIGVTIQLNSSGVEGYSVTVRLSVTGGGDIQYRVYDDNGTAAVGADVDTGVANATGIQLRIQVGDAGLLQVYHREATRGTDRSWTLSRTKNLVDAAGGAGANNIIQWGNIAAPTATASNADWSFWAVYTDDVGFQVNVGQTRYAENEGPGRRWAVIQPDDLYDEVKLAIASGPTVHRDEWTITGKAEYSADHTDIRAFPSPRIGTRSTDDGSDYDVAWERVAGLAAAHRFGFAVLALGITDANWRTADIRVANAAGTLSLLSSVDMATGRAGLPFLLSGETVRPDPGTVQAATQYYEPGELIGHTIRLDDGAENVKLRRISDNTGGFFTDDTDKQPLTITIEDADGTEPTSGTCDIWSTEGVHFVYLAASTEARGIQIRIDAQDTVDGDLRVGHLQLLECMLIGRGYSDGTVTAIEMGASLEETPDKAVWLRDLAPVRRAVEISWSATTVSTYHIEGAQASYDPPWFRAAAGGPPAGTIHGAIRAFAGALQRSNGRDPVWYLPYVPRGTTPVSGETVIRRAYRGFPAHVAGIAPGVVEVRGQIGQSGLPAQLQLETARLEELV